MKRGCFLTELPPVTTGNGLRKGERQRSRSPTGGRLTLNQPPRAVNCRGLQFAGGCKKKEGRRGAKSRHSGGITRSASVRRSAMAIFTKEITHRCQRERPDDVARCQKARRRCQEARRRKRARRREKARHRDTARRRAPGCIPAVSRSPIRFAAELRNLGFHQIPVA